MKIGVLGGTFDPVHNGHIMMAEKARDRLGLDRVLLMPAGQPMSKPGRTITAAEQRLAMLELAVEGRPGLEVSRMEIDRPGPTYTFETLTELRKCANENDELYFVLGMDSLEQIKDWRRPGEIIKRAKIITITRPGYPEPDMKELEKMVPGITEKTVFIEGMETDISATEIRAKAARGERLRGLVPEKVEEYIKGNGLYERRGQMKAVGIVGSPRKDGNTRVLVDHCLKAMAEEGIETETIPLAGMTISGCRHCEYCHEHPGECSIKDDMQAVYEKMKSADVIIVGSPVYFGSATALVKGLLERVGFCGRGSLAGKVGGPLVVARRAGKNFTFAELMIWFHIMQIVNPGSTYWNVGIGRQKGEVEEDEEGMMTAWNFGKNAARVVKKLGS